MLTIWSPFCKLIVKISVQKQPDLYTILLDHNIICTNPDWLSLVSVFAAGDDVIADDVAEDDAAAGDAVAEDDASPEVTEAGPDDPEVVPDDDAELDVLILQLYSIKFKQLSLQDQLKQSASVSHLSYSLPFHSPLSPLSLIDTCCYFLHLV